MVEQTNTIDPNEVGMYATEGKRHLYTPKGVSWDAQIDRGHKLAKEGYLVAVHRHRYMERCKTSVSPNEGCVAIRLTPETGETNVLHVSEGQSESKDPA
jgi:hypothetical protein